MGNDLEFKLERAKLIERARLDKRWTKKQLAEKAGYDEKTLYNLLSGGEVHARTIHDFCTALAIEMPEPAHRRIEVAEDVFGGYARSTYSEYEGDYVIYRPSFSKHDRIYKYVMSIAWDEVESRFRFVTAYKLDAKDPSCTKTHTGPVSISAITNLVHFMIAFRGSVRLVTVTKLRHADGVMRGCMATHFEDLDVFRPTLAPIVIRKVAAGEPSPDPTRDIRLMDKDDPDWAYAREQLSLTEGRILNLCFNAA